MVQGVKVIEYGNVPEGEQTWEMQMKRTMPDGTIELHVARGKGLKPRMGPGGGPEGIVFPTGSDIDSVNAVTEMLFGFSLLN